MKTCFLRQVEDVTELQCGVATDRPHLWEVHKSGTGCLRGNEGLRSGTAKKQQSSSALLTGVSTSIFSHMKMTRALVSFCTRSLWQLAGSPEAMSEYTCASMQGCHDAGIKLVRRNIRS